MAILTSKQVRFTVAEYLRISASGLFDDRRVELLQGRILQMHAQSNPHRFAVTKCNSLLNRHFGDVGRFWLVVQGTCVLDDYDAPDPDFALYDVPAGTPDKKLPVPRFIIEISQSSYTRDRGIKLRRYAAAGVADYWIVNLNSNRVEVYRDPENLSGRKRDWRYRTSLQFSRGSTVALLAFPEIQLSVSDMLP
jgi:Uma2 family endonuclease